MAEDNRWRRGYDQPEVPFVLVLEGEEPDREALARLRDPICVPARIEWVHGPDEAERLSSSPGHSPDPAADPATQSHAPIRRVRERSHSGGGRQPAHPERPPQAVRHATHAPGPNAAQLHERNVHDLALVIAAESGGRPIAEQRAVGFVVRNRMVRNQLDQVSTAWMHGALAHTPAQPPSRAVEQLARDILEGRLQDPTQGATHFYSPVKMPAEGTDAKRRDVGGGLESVGVTDQTGRPVRTYRPGWALTFEHVEVSGVDSTQFQFFRDPGAGHVR